jgi:hypothetical protein
MTTPDPGTPYGAPVPPAASGPSAPPPFPPAQFAPAPVPPRRRGGLVIGVIVGVVVFVLVGAGVTAALTLNRSSGTAAVPRTTALATTATTAAQTPVATDPPAFSGPLQSLVIPKPSGAVYAPEKRKGDKDGVVTKQDVASEYTGSDVDTVNSLLTQDEFQRGVFLAWTDHGTLVYIQIYQFRYDREAASWNVSVQRPAQNAATSTAVFDEIPFGRWVVTQLPDGRGAAAAYFSKGPFAVEIDTSKTGAADLDGTKKMAVDQYKLLP